MNELEKMHRDIVEQYGNYSVEDAVDRMRQSMYLGDRRSRWRKIRDRMPWSWYSRTMRRFKKQYVR